MEESEKDLESLDEKIKKLEKAEERNEIFYACPNCGSIELSMPPTVQDVFSVAWGGNMDHKTHCRECGYEGLPLIFDNENKYKEFRKFRRKKLEKKGNRLISENPASDSLREGQIPGLSAFMTVALLPGFGQLYNKEPAKAVVILASILFFLIFAVQNPAYAYTLILAAAIYIFSVYDAYVNAEK